MSRPSDYLYSADHEWLKSEGSTCLVGITDHAQQELGDVVYVDLPAIGTEVSKGDSMFTVESVKAVSDIYAPCSGTIVEVNTKLSDTPQLVNEEPFTGAWMVKISVKDEADLSTLMTCDKYNSLVAELSK